MKNQKILRLVEEIQQQLATSPVVSNKAASELESILQTAVDNLKQASPEPTVKRVDHEPSNQTPIQIWSDGACSGNPGPGGWGTIILRNGEYRELSGYIPKTTNNIMEMTGALEGIRQTPVGCQLIITSDSQYLVKGMTQWIKGWKRKNWKKADGKAVLNKSIWMELDKEASLRRVEWQWIKGHAGHVENERCDELARDAITDAGLC